MPDNKKTTVAQKEIITAPFPFMVTANNKSFHRRFVINQYLKPINPLQCGSRACSPRHSYSSKSRDYWLLHFVISGKGTLINQNGKQTVCENEIFVTRPFENVTYTADIDDPWSYMWIGFASETPVPTILEKRDVIYAPYLKELFSNAYEAEHFENIDTHGAYEHYLCGVIWQIFGMLLQNTKKDMTAEDNYIKPAITLMELYYYDINLTVEELAERLHITREHFSRIFKNETGVSPKQYLNEIRMKKAMMFLTQKNDSVTQIAGMVGFSDVFAFSRAFKHYYGCSPTEFTEKEKSE